MQGYAPRKHHRKLHLLEGGRVRGETDLTKLILPVMTPGNKQGKTVSPRDGRPVSRVATICCLKSPVSNKKNYKTFKETRKYNSYIRKKKKKTGNRNCLREREVKTNRKQLQLAIINMFKN